MYILKKDYEKMLKIIEYFNFHNKNLTKKQYFFIEDIKDVLKQYKK